MNRIDWHQIISEELELLASEEEQLAYEKNVPHVDITAELLCGWFDDSYHPDDNEFCSCFTELELAALARFNQLYDIQSSKLPESKGTVSTWLDTAAWKKVMQEAKNTLNLLMPNKSLKSRDRANRTAP